MAAAAATMHLPNGGGDAMAVDQSASTTIKIASSHSSSSSSPSLLSRAATFARTLARKAAVSVLTAGPLPSHVAFIMDGNRRFAESHLGTQDAAEGHAAGYAALLHALEWCLDLGVRTVSVFAFSVDNFSRPRAEVDALMELAREKLGELAGNNSRNGDDDGGRRRGNGEARGEGGQQEGGPTAATARATTTTTTRKGAEGEGGREDGGALLQRHGVQLRVLGELSLLPPAVAEAARAAERATEGGDRARLNVCLAYSSTCELADAVLSKLSCSSSPPPPPAAAPASPTTPLVEVGASVAAALGGELQQQQQRRSPSSLTPSPSHSPLPLAETEAAAAKATEPAAATTGLPSSHCSPLCPAANANLNLIDRALYTAGCPPVDLLLRTSGESRLSDFLLWQSRHAALVFAPRLWPELRFLDVARAVVAFQRASPRLEGLRRAAEARREDAAVREEAAAKTATVSRADDAAAVAAAAAAAEREAPVPAAAAAAPPPAAPAVPPPPPPARGGGGGGVPRRVRGSRTAGARAQAFPFSEGGGGGEAAATARAAAAGQAPPLPASGDDGGEGGENGTTEPETEDVLGWASRSTWRIKRRGDAEIEDEEGATGGPDDHGFDPHCPCCLTTGGRLIDGAADEPRNLEMPDGLEEAMLAKKRREAEVRAEMAAARAERERRAKEEERGGGEAAG